MIHAIVLSVSFIIIILIFYLITRYSSVNHPWYKISKEDRKRLKEAHRERLRRYGQVTGREKGRILYKKALMSHNGLAFYSEGMYAKFSLGIRGKYRFRGWEEISRIIKIEVENPYYNQSALFSSLRKFEFLQVETSDYLVYLIDGRTHKFDKIIPILKSSMSLRWDRVYDPRKIIKTNIIDGKVGHHTLIQDEGDVTEIPDPNGPGIKIDRSRGRLLYRESNEERERRVKQYSKVGTIFLTVGIILLVIAGVLPFIFDHFCAFTVMMLLFMIGAVLITLGIVFVRLTKTIQPIKIYWNGITNQIAATGGEVFIPFGRTTKIEEGSDWIQGKYFKLVCKDPRYSVILSKDILMIDKIVAHCRSMIGKPELDYTPHKPKISRKLKGLEMKAIIGIILVSGAIAGVVSFFWMDGGQLSVHAFFLILPPLTIILLTITGLLFSRLYAEDGSKKRLNLKVIGVIFTIMILIFMANLGSMHSVFQYEGSANIDKMPSSRIPLADLQNNTTRSLWSNIVVRDGETLSLFNTTITFMCDEPKQYSIWIENGADVQFENCIIKAPERDRGYAFEIHGKATFINCTFQFVWGDPENENLDGGIEVYSDDVRIINCSIKYCVTNGLFIYQCNPLIESNVIVGCLDDGIEIRGSRAVIRGNDISNCDWGIIVGTDSDVTISENHIHNNSHGMHISMSSPVVEGNRFSNNEIYALEIDATSDPSFEDNIFNQNGKDIRDSILREEHYIGICASAILIIVFICYGILAKKVAATKE